MTIDDLQKNTTYNVVASIFKGNAEYRHLLKMETFKTLEHEKYVPNTISNETIKLSFKPNDSDSLYALIDWQPAEGEHKMLMSFDLYLIFSNCLFCFRQYL